MEKIDEKMDQIKQEIKGVRGHKKKLKQGLVEEEPPKSTRKRKREEDESEDEPEKKRPRMPKTPEKCDEAAKRLQERLKKWELKKTEKVYFLYYFYIVVGGSGSGSGGGGGFFFIFSELYNRMR